MYQNVRVRHWRSDVGGREARNRWVKTAGYSRGVGFESRRRWLEVFSPREIVIQQGEIGDEMYFIAHGEVEVIAGGHRVAYLGEGAMIGRGASIYYIHTSHVFARIKA